MKNYITFSLDNDDHPMIPICPSMTNGYQYLTFAHVDFTSFNTNLFNSFSIYHQMATFHTGMIPEVSTCSNVKC